MKRFRFSSSGFVFQLASRLFASQAKLENQIPIPNSLQHIGPRLQRLLLTSKRRSLSLESSIHT